MNDLISHQRNAGTLHSSGDFSVDKRLALKKLAHFQLPYADAWLLKVAQAATLSGASYLDIIQTSQETRLEFDPRLPISSRQFEAIFFDPGCRPKEWLAALRVGLWSIGVGKGRPFQLRPPRSGHSLFWDGKDLRTAPTPSYPALQLHVAHRSHHVGKGWPLLRNLESTWVNAALQEAAASALYTMPLEVRLNGRRMDGFQFCPGHGFSDYDHPIGIHYLKLPGFHDLKVPPGSRENLRAPTHAHPRLRPLSQDFQSRPPATRVQAAALFSAHCHYQSGRNGGWRVEARACILCWVRYGVVVQREVFSLPPGSVSLAIFLDADQLATDATGFHIREEDAAPLRDAVCRELTPLLRVQSLRNPLVNRRQYRRGLRAAAGLTVGSFLLAPVLPSAAVVGAGSALAAFVLAGGLGYVDGNLETHLQRLSECWGSEFPVGSDSPG